MAAHIEIDRELCKSCLLCIDPCKPQIIRVSEYTNSSGYRTVEQFGDGECTGCKNCAVMCPESAITVFKD